MASWLLSSLQSPSSAAALTQLAVACAQCHRCPLGLGRQQVVVSRGNPAAPLMLIGEAPGAQEDKTGLPFVGRSGQLLNQLLEQAGLDPDQDVYICNAIKCRPPGNRKPKAAELEACRPWLEQQIRIVDPALIVLVGATAVKAVLGIGGGISQLRGKWILGLAPYLQERWLMPMFHPAYLLRHQAVIEGSPRWHTANDLKDLRLRFEALSRRY